MREIEGGDDFFCTKLAGREEAVKFCVVSERTFIQSLRELT